MKIQIARDVLAAELAKVQGVSNQKSTLLILNNVLLEARGNTLTLHGTDLDVSISTECPCEVQAEGAVTLQAKRLYDMVKSLRDDALILEMEPNHFTTLRSGKVTSRIPGTPASEFPDIQTNPETARFDLAPAQLLDMIEKTLFSVSTDEGRPNLNGALLKVGESQRLTMVSTDGHRLSRIQLPAKEGEVGFPDQLRQGVIIPRKGLVELKRILDVSNPALRFGIQGNTVVFRHGATTISVRLIDGKFPDVDQVLPAESEQKARARREDLLHALKFVSIVAPSKTGNVRISLEGGDCEIFTQDAEQGEAQEHVPIEYDGPAVKAGYNYRYLLEVLNAIDGEEITMEIIDTLSPTLIRDAGRDELLYVVMPMRI